MSYIYPKRNDKSIQWLFCLSIIVILVIIYSSPQHILNVIINSNSNEEENLVNLIRERHLIRPAKNTEPYNLNGTYHHEPYHYTILDILKKHHKQNGGFFVEAGALDGQFMSHSLDLEMDFGWRGLLVEASPDLFQQLQKKRRKSWTADVCLSSKPHMKIDYVKLKMDQPVGWHRAVGKINPEVYGVTIRGYDPKAYRSEGEVECFSLFLMLTALNVKEVDLLVLDVEGYEYKVLSSYPFEKIPIKVIAVEYVHIPEPIPELKAFMEQRGYSLKFEGKTDFIFVLDDKYWQNRS